MDFNYYQLLFFILFSNPRTTLVAVNDFIIAHAEQMFYTFFKNLPNFSSNYDKVLIDFNLYQGYRNYTLLQKVSMIYYIC